MANAQHGCHNQIDAIIADVCWSITRTSIGDTEVPISKRNKIRPSEITSESNYINRRDFIRAGAIAGGSVVSPGAFSAVIPDSRLATLADVGESPFSTDETANIRPLTRSSTLTSW